MVTKQIVIPTKSIKIDQKRILSYLINLFFEVDSFSFLRWQRAPSTTIALKCGHCFKRTYMILIANFYQNLGKFSQENFSKPLDKILLW